MAKSFTNINTDFRDPLDVITSDKAPATAPENKPEKKAKSSGEPKVKREPKSDKIKITVKEKREAKTKRTSLILKESTYNKIDSYSKKYNCSINELISQILDKVEL